MGRTITSDISRWSNFRRGQKITIMEKCHRCQLYYAHLPEICPHFPKFLEDLNCKCHKEYKEDDDRS